MLLVVIRMHFKPHADMKSGSPTSDTLLFWISLFSKSNVRVGLHASANTPSHRCFPAQCAIAGALIVGFIHATDVILCSNIMGGASQSQPSICESLDSEGALGAGFTNMAHFGVGALE